MKTYSVEEIQAEIAELDQRLAEYKNLVQRRAILLQLLSLTQQLRGSELGRKATALPTATISNGAEPRTHSDFLAKALGSGSKTIGELLAEVRRLGWQGSGDNPTDKKRLYVALYREKDKFKLGPDSKWSLLSQAQASSA